MRYEWRDPRGALWEIDTANRVVTRFLSDEEQQNPRAAWSSVMDQCQTMGLYHGQEPVTRFTFHKEPGSGETVYRHITRLSRGKAPESIAADAVNNLNRSPRRAQDFMTVIIAVVAVVVLLSCLVSSLSG